MMIVSLGFTCTCLCCPPKPEAAHEQPQPTRLLNLRAIRRSWTVAGFGGPSSVPNNHDVVGPKKMKKEGGNF